MQLRLAFAVFAFASSIFAAPSSSSDDATFIVSLDKNAKVKSTLSKSGLHGLFPDAIHKFNHGVVVKGKYLSKIAKEPGIRIEQDLPVKTVATQLNPPSWGLDRIDQHNLSLDTKFTYPDSAGSGVNVYVLDTGVRATHQEFATNRAVFAANFQGDGIDTDCNGHGTHVSSTIAGVTVGVGKKVNIFGVKVLGCGGTGSFSGVIAGIQYVIDQHNASANKKTIINMSLAGGRTQAVNDMVDAASAAGILVVVAAGNDAQDACNVSPASAPSALTIAASDITDHHAGFSNFGTCVDLYGPGVNIYGAFNNADNGYATISGTSMASPHVAGTAAVDWSTGIFTQPALAAKILSDATPNKIIGIPANTANKLVFLPTPGLSCTQSISTFDGQSIYCVLAPDTRDNSAATCTSGGGHLVDLDTVGEFSYLAGKITAPSWARSWQGNNYSGACLLLYPGGALVPAGSCAESHQSICEIPI